ncbi:uncharacterized protein TRAVEDRAFT_74567 [Trametes versicolor FP-101664 SS1]|uniref:uncharacterized protein n=1 Tax=Trametes versicolor (strain FP-101664) TaxID=717944 RepID=UPI0004622EE9|nr:uncharacterized protein TRAVEDRAFT_74567 [Trametes versicolor FP-101664 SS1]EIW54562.1 hypothetical protein TRAVEDRAFT_74567 [Trametes versicolor FP-101664 SS1]
MSPTASSGCIASLPLNIATMRRRSLRRPHRSQAYQRAQCRHLQTRTTRSVSGSAVPASSGDSTFAHSPRGDADAPGGTLRLKKTPRDPTAQEDSEGPSRSISAPLDAYDAPQLPTWAPTAISGCLPPRFLDGAVTQPHQSTYARTIGLRAPHTRSLGAPGRLLAARGERPGGVCSHGMPPASARIRARVCDDAARFWRVRVRGYGPTQLASRRAIPASLGCWGGVRVEGVPGACSRSSACSFGRAGSTLAPCTVRVR